MKMIVFDIVQVVKVQMQAKENLGRYTGVMNCASSLVQTEGPFALYKGLESHLWRNAVWNGELILSHVGQIYY